MSCGDGACDGSEDCGSCPTDCGDCIPPEPNPMPGPFPAMVALEFASSMVDGNHGNWSEERSRQLVTQSRLPYLNGGFGTEDAECGLNGRIIKVTNLNDSGSGSLRAAVEASGKRTVVFEISGAIALNETLVVRDPFLTIAGQTAPPPGIALYHQTLRVATHDVCVQHIRIRPGDRVASGALRTDFNVADAVNVRTKTGEPVYNVVLDNLSLSWAMDEILDVGGPGISDITIRDVFFAEPLLGSNGHAYCTMLSDYGANEKRASYVANVYAHCYRRNPRVGEGTNVVVNQFIYNPGRHAIHISGNANTDDIWTSMVGNTMAFPSDAADRYDGWRSAFALIENVYQWEPRQTRVYLAGNHATGGYEVFRDFDNTSSPAELIAGAEVWDRTIYPMYGADIEAVILSNVGAFPKFRDPVDLRVIADIRNRQGTYIQSQDDVGGYPVLPVNHRVLTPPSSPQGDSDDDGISDLREWLQSYTNAVE